MEYRLIIPLGYLGGIHCKVTEVEVTESETISNCCGSLGATNKLDIIFYGTSYIIIQAYNIHTYTLKHII